jgi:hypothetical protein
LIPFCALNQVLSRTYPQNSKTNAAVVSCYVVAYIGWISIALASNTYPGLKGVASTVFVMTGVILGTVRSHFRSHYNIRSNWTADLLGSLFFWPQVLAQMSMEYKAPTITLDKPCNKARMRHAKEYDA